MNKKLLTIGILLSAVLLWGVGNLVSAQSADLWFMRTIAGTKYLMPVVSSWVARFPSGASGTTLTLSTLKSCDTIDTDGNGVLTCGTDGGSSYTAGQGLALNGAVFSRLENLTGSTLNLTGLASMSGALSVDGMLYAQGGVTGALTGNATTATTAAAGDSATAFFSSGLMELAYGGTNKNMTAVNGGVVYTDADSMEVTAASTSGQLLIGQGAAAPQWKADIRTLTWVIGGGVATGSGGTAMIMPWACDVTGLEMAINEAPVTQLIRIDIQENGATLFSTKPEIDTSAIVDDNNHAFSDTALIAGSRVNVEVEQAGGAGGSGTGMTVLLSCSRHP